MVALTSTTDSLTCTRYSEQSHHFLTPHARCRGSDHFARSRARTQVHLFSLWPNHLAMQTETLPVTLRCSFLHSFSLAPSQESVIRSMIANARKWDRGILRHRDAIFCAPSTTPLNLSLRCFFFLLFVIATLCRPNGHWRPRDPVRPADTHAITNPDHKYAAGSFPFIYSLSLVPHFRIFLSSYTEKR